ncbi:hypothetical protein SAICODRAFT_73210 [Saitoella complicata NRRL Y-17804]|uniref:Uncharacterized protein n=1 Tax=Saitoella complicata (strain BCRC 22490 / CBS 7301 / JCM 7358 / NBRC 10748 / NRRL Y-17804) TaxID=698492 RepID=A0A0E9NE45_SAICN|nr:uncharacterized protein SAICODRAFT_73210 [Saitoella complicata NRRL Y-17804]ODQ50713.1 hypothetical protein SAICODRAFT_73210 [Saitoella complicata NRRL Y-17804]GAO47971.1 hypothetical protein G7K_2163-t1 [Saitoella complicata NRRL Y-17804]
MVLFARSPSPKRRQLPPTTTRQVSTTKGTQEVKLLPSGVNGISSLSPSAISVHPNSKAILYTAGGHAVLSQFRGPEETLQRIFSAPRNVEAANERSRARYASPGGPANPVDARAGRRSPSKLGPNASLAAAYIVNGSSPSSRGRFSAPNTGNTYSDKGSESGAPVCANRVSPFISTALSPDGRFAAVGEEGAKPRVLIYFLEDLEANNYPFVIQDNDHGIQCLAFSPCSRYLAVLGVMHDGLISVYDLGVKTRVLKPELVAKNNVKSAIFDMQWVSHGENSTLVTVGRRQVRRWFWTTDKDKPPGHSKFVPALLQKRDVILGDEAFSDGEFVSVRGLGNEKVVVASRTGSIFAFEENGPNNLMRVHDVGHGVLSMDVDYIDGWLWVGGPGGVLTPVDTDLFHSGSSQGSRTPPKIPALVPSDADITTVLFLGKNQIAVVNDRRTIHLLTVTAKDEEESVLERSAPCHENAIKGVRRLSMTNSLGATHMTWDARAVCFWTENSFLLAKMDIDIEQRNWGVDEYEVNELECAALTSDGQLIAGDKYGTVSVIDLETEEIVFRMSDAHLDAISGIDIAKNGDVLLFVTASRDRTAQIFAKSKSKPAWRIVDTVEDTMPMTRAVFLRNALVLATCSSNEKVLTIRRLARPPMQNEANELQMAFTLPHKITLSNSPCDMLARSAGKSELIVTSSDGTVHIIDCGDAVGLLPPKVDTWRTDTALARVSIMHLDRPVLVRDQHKKQRQSNLLIAAIGKDKSLRIYDYATGGLVVSQAPQCRGPTGMVFVRYFPQANAVHAYALVVTTSDGVICRMKVEGLRTVCPVDSSSPALAGRVVRNTKTKEQLATWEISEAPGTRMSAQDGAQSSATFDSYDDELAKRFSPVGECPSTPTGPGKRDPGRTGRTFGVRKSVSIPNLRQSAAGTNRGLEPPESPTKLALRYAASKAARPDMTPPSRAKVASWLNDAATNASVSPVKPSMNGKEEALSVAEEIVVSLRYLRNLLQTEDIANAKKAPREEETLQSLLNEFKKTSDMITGSGVEANSAVNDLERTMARLGMEGFASRLVEEVRKAAGGKPSLSDTLAGLESRGEEKEHSE